MSSSSDDSTVIGLYLIARHGDREGLYQNPITYTMSDTVITPLGAQQEFQLGEELRSKYINQSSPLYIQGINTTLYNDPQVTVQVDAGGEGDVITISSLALLSGLFPATPEYTVTLANGSTIEGPLGGFQYVPIQTILPDVNYTLEGFTDCNTFATNTAAFYNSSFFATKANQSAAFLNALEPYVGGRPTQLSNMWNIFDYMNVESIHNATFANQLPPTFLEQARDLANWHEYYVFSSPELDGIGNIAGQAMAYTIINNFNRLADLSDPLKLAYNAISYKPFISLFNMTGVAQAYPELQGIVNYAAALALELRQPSGGGEPVVRFNFKNGMGAEWNTYNWLYTTGDVPLSSFINFLTPYTINTTSEWCSVCNNSVNRGCDAISAAYTEGYAAGSGSHSSRAHSTRALSEPIQLTPQAQIGEVGAGFIGVGATLIVELIVFGMLCAFGLVSLGRMKKSAVRLDDDDSYDNMAQVKHA